MPMRAVVAGVIALLLVAGCSAPVTSAPTAAPAPSVTITVTVTAAPEANEGDRCDYRPGMINAVISSWDSVKASRGAVDHARKLASMSKDIASTQGMDAAVWCVGAPELAFLARVVAEVSDWQSKGAELDDDSYEKVVDAGNRWLDAMGNTEYRFTLEPGDAG